MKVASWEFGIMDWYSPLIFFLHPMYLPFSVCFNITPYLLSPCIPHMTNLHFFLLSLSKVGLIIDRESFHGFSSFDWVNYCSSLSSIEVCTGVYIYSQFSDPLIKLTCPLLTTSPMLWDFSAQTFSLFSISILLRFSVSLVLNLFLSVTLTLERPNN
jgi:hypothetical protein